MYLCIMRILETIKYYLTQLWIRTFIFNKVVIPMIDFDETLNYCSDKNDAIKHSKIKFYKYIPNFYKLKKIHEKFN